MDKVIIFTSFEKIKAVVNEELVNLNNLSLLSKNRFIGLDESNAILQPIDNCSEANVILIKDDLSRHQFNRFIQNCPPDQIVVLKHREPGFSDFDDFKICYIGMHEKEGNFYPDVFEILTDKKGSVHARLLKEVFNVDSNLANRINLFQGILNGEISEHLVKKMPEFSEELDEFRPFLQADMLSTEYIIAFEKLSAIILS